MTPNMKKHSYKSTILLLLILISIASISFSYAENEVDLNATDMDHLLDSLSEETSPETPPENLKELNIKSEETPVVNHGIESTNFAEVVVINKITTKSEKVLLKIGDLKYLGNISVEIHKCVKDTNPYKPNNSILLTIFDNKIDDDRIKIFHGWMMSNNLSVSTLEHPVYEVIPVSCLAKKP